ncbi:hypothetical protein D3C78_745590 [compost metagenome]
MSLAVLGFEALVDRVGVIGSVGRLRIHALGEVGRSGGLLAHASGCAGIDIDGEFSLDLELDLSTTTLAFDLELAVDTGVDRQAPVPFGRSAARAVRFHGGVYRGAVGAVGAGGGVIAGRERG